MINQNIHAINTDRKHAAFGARLRKTREAMGLDRKEAASQLFLNEKMIIMLESGEIDASLPLTFVRGYLRSYSKLLDIPEQDVKVMLEALQPKPVQEEAPSATIHPLTSASDTGSPHAAFDLSHFFVQLITYLVAITVLGLSGVWWYTQQTPEPTPTVAHTPPKAAHPNLFTPPPTPTTTIETTSRANTFTSANTGNKGLTTVNDAAPKPTEPLPPTALTPAQPHPVTAIPARHDKRLLTEWVMPSYQTQLLFGACLLAAIIAAGMRLYGHYLQPARMAKNARVVRTPGKPNQARYAPKKQPIFKIAFDYANTNRTMIFFGLIIIASLLGLIRSHWHESTPPSHPTMATVQPKQAKPQVAPPVMLDVTLPDLPDSQLQTVLMANFPRYAVQQLQATLRDYIAQAATVKFILTDKSSPLSQFKTKKHARNRRPAYMNYDNNYSSENYNQTGYPATE